MSGYNFLELGVVDDLADLDDGGHLDKTLPDKPVTVKCR